MTDVCSIVGYFKNWLCSCGRSCWICRQRVEDVEFEVECTLEAYVLSVADGAEVIVSLVGGLDSQLCV